MRSYIDDAEGDVDGAVGDLAVADLHEDRVDEHRRPSGWSTAWLKQVVLEDPECAVSLERRE